MGRPASERRCDVDSCERKHYAHGLCQMHYTRVRTTGSTGEAESRRETPVGLCRAAEGCERTIKAKGLCSMHYHRLLRHGDENFVTLLRAEGLETLPGNIATRIQAGVQA